MRDLDTPVGWENGAGDAQVGGAQWGSIHAHGFLRDAVLLSDDARRDLPKVPSGKAGWNGNARELAVGPAVRLESPVDALCWVHAERLLHKLDTFTDLHRAAQQRMRTADPDLLRRSQGL